MKPFLQNLLKFLAISTCVLLAELGVYKSLDAQISPTPATIMSGPLTPIAASMPCGLGQASTSTSAFYNQTGLGTTNSIWKCATDDGGVTYSWHAPFASPVAGTAISSSITGGTFLLGGCTATTNVTVTGAVVGTNGVQAAPIFSTAFPGNLGLFNVTGAVTAANTVTVQGCALAALSSVPNFTVKVLLY